MSIYGCLRKTELRSGFKRKKIVEVDKSMNQSYLAALLGLAAVGMYMIGAPLAIVGAMLSAAAYTGYVMYTQMDLGKPYVAIRANRVHMSLVPNRVRVSYEWPKSFKRYTMVYDPSKVTFGEFLVTVDRNRGVTNEGRRKDPGSRLISEPGKFEVVLYGKEYVAPKSATDTNTITSVDVQFFTTNASERNALQAALQTAEFRAYTSPSTFTKISRGTGF